MNPEGRISSTRSRSSSLLKISGTLSLPFQRKRARTFLIGMTLSSEVAASHLTAPMMQ
jgi:hypothetical protein